MAKHSTTTIVVWTLIDSLLLGAVAYCFGARGSEMPIQGWIAGIGITLAVGYINWRRFWSS